MLRVPGYLPREVLGPLVPWAQGYVKRLAAKSHAPVTDLWDEAVTALLRASIHGERVPGICGNTIGGKYGQTAVRRACWRYVMRAVATRPVHQSLTEFLEQGNRERNARGNAVPPMPPALQDRLDPLTMLCALEGAIDAQTPPPARQSPRASSARPSPRMACRSA